MIMRTRFSIFFLLGLFFLLFLFDCILFSFNSRNLGDTHAIFQMPLIKRNICTIKKIANVLQGAIFQLGSMFFFFFFFFFFNHTKILFFIKVGRRGLDDPTIYPL